MNDLNQFTCTARLGADPEARTFKSGDPVVNLRVAVSESWKTNGEKKERTLWMPVVITSKGLCEIANKYLKKGSKVALSGKLQSRSWEKDGSTIWVTELILGPFNSTLTMLDSKSGGGFGNSDSLSGNAPDESGSAGTGNNEPNWGNGGGGDLDDEIPF